MKYFALLTKLGENLLAQATALGTKLELTHMAVGDGGGSLPTPDTNQTKLIAEKRRAAINTLFIDDKNKNQIIAEQIIPEQDGGWWIREIGLFDKAGNLIAVANCPETYKPQLAEGSGRTQSIRMVLIVSHTESVTLKIDPSVVLATREYVNTEITVLDKKIDALSAQIKLDLNKKFDKANISGQKGNDNDKVPSLNLFTTEIGKLAALGYSYSKIESDGRYQPKGNYAPAGDYATRADLTNGLNGKFDKTGGVLSNHLSVIGRVYTRSNNTVDANEISIDAINASGNCINSKRGTDPATTHYLPKTTGTLMQVGDYGLGIGLYQTSDIFNSTTLGCGFYAMPGGKGNPWGSNGSSHILNVRQGNYGFQIGRTTGDMSLSFRTLSVGVFSGISKIYSTANTEKDHNGNVKIPGYLERSDYPVGCPIPCPQATAPAGYLICNGQSFNKITYPLLAKAYPTGVLPDLRGEFLRGLDAGRNVDSGRAVLSLQLDENKEHNHNIILKNASGDGGSDQYALRTLAINVNNATYTTEKSGGKESRPRNIAFLYIVRAA
ncbi:hypothetical protein CHI95_13330 [Providencia rettgeri]|uniref:Uncharacterized protein n=1 Tax=Providencia rettgeri TaxID=587 RepID=A0A264VRT5_PRORE|nr:phage tail protein [Providencia rettgeri]OZS74070.1 hypothetical protein CHI95_13330 [Providencia rettgeri]